MSLQWGLEMRVMDRDKPNGNTPAFPALSIFRGLYQRVAGKLGVDPSYVSRVARGERRSAVVVAALQEEMDLIRQHLNHQDAQFLNGQTQNGNGRDGKLHDGQMQNGSSQDPAKSQSVKNKLAGSTRRSSVSGNYAKAAD
jgi:hypothetical protein